jgi:hypothetical protein
MTQPDDATRSPEQVDALTSAVERLTEQIAVLTQAMDDLRTDVQWLIQNREQLEPALQKTIDEISDDVQVLVRRAFQPQADHPRILSERVANDPGVPNLSAIAVPEPTLPSPLQEATPATVGAEPIAESTSRETQPDPPSTPQSEPISERNADRPSGAALISPPAQQRKNRPLHERMYFQRHMTDIVRAIGYEVLLRDEALARVRPMIDQYGRAAIESAAEELLEVEENGATTTVRLRDHARQLARQILGRPPEAGAAQTQKPGAPKSQPIVVPKVDVSQLKAIKTSRQKAVAEFQKHMESRGLVFEKIDDKSRCKYTNRHLAALDFIVREEGAPPELITIRKTVTETQRHDLAEWKAIIGNEATVSMIWQYVDDAGRQSWETVELDFNAASATTERQR